MTQASNDELPHLPGIRVRQFFDLEAKVLGERFLTVEKLLPHATQGGAAHRGEEGRHIESILRDFLNRHLPRELRAFSGFILKPATKVATNDLSRVDTADRHSKQLDVIVFDQARYPIYEQFEEFVIVPPEGVIGIVSVKKTLYSSQLLDELIALREAAELCATESETRGPHLGIFAFRGEGRRTRDEWGELIFQSAREAMEGAAFNSLINEVAIFDKMVAFKYRPSSSAPLKARYVRCDVEADDGMHLPIGRMLQSLLSVYYGRLGMPRPGFASFNKGAFGDAPVLGDIDYK